MARSKSKHVRLIMRRRKQWKARTKRQAEAAKSGTRPVKKAAPAKKLLPTPPAAPPAAAAEPQA
jgi:hypothetical protein